VELIINNGGGGASVKNSKGKRAPVPETGPTVAAEDVVAVGGLSGWTIVARRKIEKGRGRGEDGEKERGALRRTRGGWGFGHGSHMVEAGWGRSVAQQGSEVGEAIDTWVQPKFKSI
jgi:hypothetical protein